MKTIKGMTALQFAQKELADARAALKVITDEFTRGNRVPGFVGASLRLSGARSGLATEKERRKRARGKYSV